MDELKGYELPILMENLLLATKISWEQTRMMYYGSLKHILKKNTGPLDIMHLPWDEKNTTNEKTDLKFDDKQISAMKEMLIKQNKARKGNEQQ